MQEAFDAAVLGTMLQGEKAVREDGKACEYTTAGGLHCTAWWVLPQEITAVSMGVAFTLAQASGWSLKIGDLLTCLQSAHDMSDCIPTFSASFALRAQAIAHEYGLDSSIVERFQAGEFDGQEPKHITEVAR